MRKTIIFAEAPMSVAFRTLYYAEAAKTLKTIRKNWQSFVEVMGPSNAQAVLEKETLKLLTGVKG